VFFEPFQLCFTVLLMVLPVILIATFPTSTF
jgi:hypothetical protein